jgi:hypothetical protein
MERARIDFMQKKPAVIEGAAKADAEPIGDLPLVIAGYGKPVIDGSNDLIFEWDLLSKVSTAHRPARRMFGDPLIIFTASPSASSPMRT